MPLKITSQSSTLSVRCSLRRNLSSKSLIGLRSMACKYRSLSTNCQSTTIARRRFSIKSSQMRIERPFPSIKGWHTFIPTYLATSCSNVSSGIFSTASKAAWRYKLLANRNPPLAIFLSHIFPAKSYSPSKR